MAQGGEDDVFDELIDKAASAGTEDAGIDKTGGWIETNQMFRFRPALTQMEQIAALHYRSKKTNWFDNLGRFQNETIGIPKEKSHIQRAKGTLCHTSYLSQPSQPLVV